MGETEPKGPYPLTPEGIASALGADHIMSMEQVCAERLELINKVSTLKSENERLRKAISSIINKDNFVPTVWGIQNILREGMNGGGGK